MSYRLVGRSPVLVGAVVPAIAAAIEPAVAFATDWSAGNPERKGMVGAVIAGRTRLG